MSMYTCSVRGQETSAQRATARMPQAASAEWLAECPPTATEPGTWVSELGSTSTISSSRTAREPLASRAASCRPTRTARRSHDANWSPRPRSAVMALRFDLAFLRVPPTLDVDQPSGQVDAISAERLQLAAAQAGVQGRCPTARSRSRSAAMRAAASVGDAMRSRPPRTAGSLRPLGRVDRDVATR